MTAPFRVLAVFLRNLLVWRKHVLSSLLSNIAEPLITLVAFGYGLGALIGSVALPGDPGARRLPYVVFLASGSVCMSAMNSATFEALYSAFSRMHLQKTWEGILNAPITLDDIVLAECLWAAFKSLVTALAIVAVVVVLGISRAPTLLLVPPIAVLIGMTFGSVALVITALAKGYEFFAYYFTIVLTPMTFISGIYFPATALPGWMDSVARILPLHHAIQLVRPLFLGELPAAPLVHLGVLVGYTVVGYRIALLLTRRRLGL